MSFRYKFSIILIALGFIGVIMSFNGKNTSSLSPEEILTNLKSGQSEISADELAAMLAESDENIQIVDVRNPEDYSSASLPGSVNIPLESLFEPQNLVVFETTEDINKILYSENDDLAIQAWILTAQKGFKNMFILRGGLVAWDSIVMKSKFEGQSISASENIVFEKRFKARRLFNQWNTMPDSLKAGFFAAKQLKEKELVGGCE